MTFKVWRNLKIPSPGASEWFILFTEAYELPEFLNFSVENLFFVYIKSFYEYKLDIASGIDFDVILEFTKSLNFGSD